MQQKQNTAKDEAHEFARSLFIRPDQQPQKPQQQYPDIFKRIMDLTYQTTKTSR